jgi:hypothetical protein
MEDGNGRLWLPEHLLSKQLHVEITDIEDISIHGRREAEQLRVDGYPASWTDHPAVKCSQLAQWVFDYLRQPIYRSFGL